MSGASPGPCLRKVDHRGDQVRRYGRLPAVGKRLGPNRTGRRAVGGDGSGWGGTPPAVRHAPQAPACPYPVSRMAVPGGNVVRVPKGGNTVWASSGRSTETTPLQRPLLLRVHPSVRTISEFSNHFPCPWTASVTTLTQGTSDFSPVRVPWPPAGHKARRTCTSWSNLPLASGRETRSQ